MTRRTGRSAALLVLVAGLGSMELGCGLDDGSPEGAAQLFVRAAAMGDNAKIFGLLHPEVQEKLTQMATLATAQTGGQRRFKPEDLVAASLTQARQSLASVHGVRVTGDRAAVRLTEATGKVSEELELERVRGRWRVRLDLKAALSHDETEPVGSHQGGPFE